MCLYSAGTSFFPTHFIWTGIRLVRHCAVCVFGIKVKKGMVVMYTYRRMELQCLHIHTQRDNLFPSSNSNEWHRMAYTHSRHTNSSTLLLCVFCRSYKRSRSLSLSLSFSLLILTLVFVLMRARFIYSHFKAFVLLFNVCLLYGELSQQLHTKHIPLDIVLYVCVLAAYGIH